MRDLVRTRWAAIGAAVAITLGAGGISLTHAAIDSGPKPVYVALDAPCRVVDTRPGTTIGPKGTQVEAGDTNAYEIQITGDSGECTGALAVPADALAVALNVTAIQPSSPTGRSFFTVYPGDEARPNTSNLNFLSGQAPVPNKVDVGLSATGTIKLYNAFGAAHAAVDIFGYYVDHTHDDRYYTETEVDTALAGKADAAAVAGKADAADVYTKAEIDAALAPKTVVLSQGTNDITPNVSSSISVGYFAGGSTLTGTGLAQISLTGPHMVGDATYELTSVEYCITNASADAAVDQAVVYIHGINFVVGPSASDDTDQGLGCHTLDVGLVNEEGFDFGIRKIGGGSLTLSGLTTTWTPVTT